MMNTRPRGTHVVPSAINIATCTPTDAMLFFSQDQPNFGRAMAAMLMAFSHAGRLAEIDQQVIDDLVTHWPREKAARQPTRSPRSSSAYAAEPLWTWLRRIFYGK